MNSVFPDRNSLIYVAGHTGLIGSAFMRRLRREGYANLFTALRSELDLSDAAKVRAFFERINPEIVILAAGKVGGIIENQTFPADFMRENLGIQMSVMNAALQAGVKKLIFFGSSCMYPRECPQPMGENLLLSGKPEITSLPYAIAKLAGVHMCLAYNKQYGQTRFIPVIPNNAYGPNDDFNLHSSHVLSALIRKFHEAKQKNDAGVMLWGSGTPSREFIHSDDIASACLHLLENDSPEIVYPINIGVGVDCSIRELAETVATVVGYHGKIEFDTSKPDGSPRKLLDGSRLLSMGWQPKVALIDGIRETYQWYLNNQGEFGD